MSCVLSLSLHARLLDMLCLPLTPLSASESQSLYLVGCSVFLRSQIIASHAAYSRVSQHLPHRLGLLGLLHLVVASVCSFALVRSASLLSLLVEVCLLLPVCFPFSLRLGVSLWGSPSRFLSGVAVFCGRVPRASLMPPLCLKCGSCSDLC